MSEVHTQTIYNLPLGYDDNKIVLLIKDPHWLFAYWEISDTKRNSFFEEFGHELWGKSVPVLKIINVSRNTNFFIRINDFSSNWYINVPDSSCLYTAEIGRKVADQFFINLVSSNYINTSEDSVSSNTSAHFINFNDLRNGSLDTELGKIYETYGLKTHSRTISGLSSHELFGLVTQESMLGISSAELFGINIEEHLGISSESFIK